jgi:hypothetical protein
MKVYGTNSIDGFFFTLIAQHTHTQSAVQSYLG